MKKMYFAGVLALTVILGAVLAYSIWQARPLTSQAYYESGKKYYEAKKYPEATIQLLNSVREDPSNREARFLLAMTYASQEDIVRAAVELKALLEYYPDDVPANLQLGGIYLISGRAAPDLFHQAQEIASRILEKDPKNLNALILSGNAATGLQDYRTSVDFYEKALNLDPQNLSAFISLGTSQTLQKNYTEAEQAFLKAREIGPKDKTALISLGNYYRAVQQNAKAEAAFKDALNLFPDDRQVYLQLVDFYNQSGRFDDVEKLLRDVQAKAPKNPEPSLILADLYGSKNRPGDARKLLLETKDKFPKDLDVAVKVAMNFLQDQPQRARTEVDEIMKLDPRDPVGSVLLGELQFIAGDYDAAQATFEKPLVIDSPYPQVHFFLGNIQLRKGQLDQAVFHYQKSLAVKSSYIPARVALAEVFATKGKLADSREELRKALDARSDYVPARILQAALDSADKSNKNAEQELAKLAKEQPENALVYRQMGLYYESRGRIAEAEKNLVRALELQPDSQQRFRDLSLFYIRQKQMDRVIQRVNAVPEVKRQALHYELMGLAYSQSGKTQEAEKAFKTAQAKDPTATSSEVYLLADYMKSGRVNDTLQTLDDIIKKSPQNIEAYGVKAQLYEKQGNLEEAKKYYLEALKVNPNYEPAANNLAYILAEQGTDLNTALGYAQMARKKQPENPTIADTLGWVYYKTGNYVLAQEQLRFAVSKQPNNPEFQYHLGMIYKQNKRASDAEAALKKALSSRANFKDKSLAQNALQEIASSQK
jgi:tetratricopeptide (TPR) repeat protein